MNVEADRKSDEIVKLQDKISQMKDEYTKIGKILIVQFC